MYASSDRDTPYGSVASSVTAVRSAEAEADWLWGVVLREERQVDPKQVRYLRSRAWRPALAAIMPAVRPVQLLWFELPLMVRPPPLGQPATCVLREAF